MAKRTIYAGQVSEELVGQEITLKDGYKREEIMEI